MIDMMNMKREKCAAPSSYKYGDHERVKRKQFKHMGDHNSIHYK